MKHSTFNVQPRTSNSPRASFGNLLERWKLNVGCWLFSALLLFAAGCAAYHSQPISPQETTTTFDTRSFTNENLHAFLETNHIAGEWPRPSWDLNALSFVAFYYQPALAEARAHWA